MNSQDQINPLERLQTYDHCQLLDIVDGLRAQGLSNILPLPQLIVCGDQSSGKSSVLEAICGVPFPKKDNLCTRFATEVILRRNTSFKQNEAHVTILPGQTRSETDRKNLENFSRLLQDVGDLPDTIQAAKEAMGLGSQGHNAFSTDVLRLEIIGPEMPQLTIVDLPGLIHSETKSQTTQDVELVSQLVESYMVQPRSIILAVISAKNDHANQIILRRARKADRTGERTLGVITKPDTLHEDSASERSFIELASNSDIVFKLGWHVVRNIDTNDSKEKAASRDEVERTFFQNRNWKKLGHDNLGVTSLRSRLSEVLFAQITRELPRLIQEIETCKSDTQAALGRLGRTRETEHDQRQYLLDLNQRIYETCRAGCDGNYDDSFFLENDSSLQPHKARRMRALIQNQSREFKERLESTGSRWHTAEVSKPEQGILTRGHAVERVVSLLERSRGRELPGTFNPLLISELFQEYSSPWEGLAQQFVEQIWQCASQFLVTILRHLTDDPVFESYKKLIITPAMDKIFLEANKALKLLLEERKRHAITYDPEFVATLAAQDEKRLKVDIEKKLKLFFGNRAHALTDAQIPQLATFLANQEHVDPNLATAEEVYNRMQSYYQIALKRLADNVPIHVIENVVVQELRSVAHPSHAWNLSSDLVQIIAGESPEMQQHRRQLIDKFEILVKGETTCKRYTGNYTPASSYSFEEDTADSVFSCPSASAADDNEPLPIAQNLAEGIVDSEPVEAIGTEARDPWEVFGSTLASKKDKKKKKGQSAYVDQGMHG